MSDTIALKKQWNKVYDNLKGKRQSVWRENASPFFVNKIDYFKHLGLKTVLDAGCGDGRNLIEFTKLGFKVTGVDVSNSALEKCKKNCRNYKNFHLEEQDLENLKFAKNSFDIIICDFVMAHMENPEKIVQNFYRILKKNGFVLIEFTSTKDPHCGQGKKIKGNEYTQKEVYIRFYDIKEIEKIMENFKVLTIDSQEYTDPPHDSGYIRKSRHKHHSYFVLGTVQ
ncbi:MAG: class I SAM-dependent methyltransferase [Candidatus Diapherotrites archaeon]|nr:class I SAM-dependent methyltransferase [Candidatus Diapherotrites archaeon]